MNLPNFFIIGANKAGTTSLHHYCAQHPDIFMSRIKEPMFFTARPEPLVKPKEATLGKPFNAFTLKEYAALFSGATEEMLGESSTAYLANPGKSALWIRKMIPDAKLIVVLRNPLERAYSNYKMYKAKNLDERSFEEAVLTEIEDGPKRLPQGKRYLHLGLYGKQISLFYRYFSQDQVFIGDYDELNSNSVDFLQKVFGFLGVSEFVPSDMGRLNKSIDREGYKSRVGNRSKDTNIKKPYSVEIERKMKAFYCQDILKLQELVLFDVLKWIDWA